MGVDASLFAKKAKKYFYFDRDYNLRSHDWVDDCPEDAYEIQSGLHKELSSQWLCDSDVIYFLKENIEIWKEYGDEEDKCRIYWSKKLIKFVEAHPGDKFFIARDNENMYDLIDEGYIEVKENTYEE